MTTFEGEEALQILRHMMCFGADPYLPQGGMTSGTPFRDLHHAVQYEITTSDRDLELAIDFLKSLKYQKLDCPCPNSGLPQV